MSGQQPPEPADGGEDADLTAIRDRIEALDGTLMDLIEERVSLATNAGEVKRRNGLAPRDFVVERTVVDRFRRGFDDRGLDADAGERIAHELFTETLRTQEERVRQLGSVTEQRVLIVGGAGQMGVWLTDYFDTLGHEVAIYDIVGAVAGHPMVDDLRDAAETVDSVVVSVPPDAVRSVLAELEGVDTPIIEIASLKAPFIDELLRLASQQPVASVHPMWGPATSVLSDKYLILCDCESPEGTEAARTLFEPSMASIVEIPLSEHDEAMVYTQVLPQAISLLFAEVTSGSPFTLEELDERAGGSFIRQAGVTEGVVHRDPQLYRQIQALNEHAPALYDRIEDAIGQLLLDRTDPAAFTDAMRRYRHYFNGNVEARHP